jgi:hypothetical protein
MALPPDAAPVITRGNPTHVSLMLVGAEATLEFPDRGRIAGRGTCSRFFGTVVITGE